MKQRYQHRRSVSIVAARTAFIRKMSGLLSGSFFVIGSLLCHADGVLMTKPLEPLSKEETLLRHMEKHFNRQNEEKYPLVEKLDPKGWFFVDLKPYCNLNLFSAAGRTCPVSFHHMPLGKQTFYGVPFDIVPPEKNRDKTVVALPSKRLLPNDLPPSVEVVVGRKASVLYFLTASYYTLPEGEQSFQLNYDDGSTHQWPIVGTKDLGDWYHDHTRVYNENTHYVLIRRSAETKTAFRNMHIVQRENPHPGKAIKSITFKTDPKAPMAILVVAVTGH